MFDFLASLLAWFYSVVDSYGLAILLLTLTIMLVFTPLIFKSTKSMIGMRKVQPKVRKLQKKYKDDKETLNKKTMELYQQHGVNPVGGCLPLFFQAPVFLVMYRVVRGATRRTLDTGFTSGNATTKAALSRTGINEDIALEVSDTSLNRFNPEYLKPSTKMYQDLANSNEMDFLGLDLSRTTTEMFAISPFQALPYVGIVILVGALSLFQHRQIQGRMTSGAMNPQMEMITKFMPWFLPIFALGMPAALCIYFMGQSVVRVGQQAYITKRFYGDDVEDDDDDDDDEDFGDDDDDGDDGPGGLLGQLMGGAAAAPKDTASSRHGSRSPVSAGAKRPASRKPAATSRTTPKASTAKSNGSAGSRSAKPVKPGTKASAGATAAAESESGGSLWAKARRRAEQATAQNDSSSSTADTSSRSSSRTSKRVTPKGGSTSPSKKRK